MAKLTHDIVLHVLHCVLLNSQSGGKRGPDLRRSRIEPRSQISNRGRDKPRSVISPEAGGVKACALDTCQKRRSAGGKAYTKAGRASQRRREIQLLSISFSAQGIGRPLLPPRCKFAL